MQDEQSLLFGGTDAPCAIAQLNSIGSINLENNRAFSAAFSALIAEHGIPEDRYVSEHPSFCVTHALTLSVGQYLWGLVYPGGVLHGSSLHTLRHRQSTSTSADFVLLRRDST